MNRLHTTKRSWTSFAGERCGRSFRAVAWWRPRPIVAPGTPFVGDLQAWIRNLALQPDWLRIGTDIIGGNPLPTFNMTFSLTGETVLQAGTPGRANCHGKSISALAHQFGGLDAAASALQFSSVETLQGGVEAFCQP
jgi:hypothetical protein